MSDTSTPVPSTPGMGPAAAHVVVLAFDLLDEEILDSPALLEKTLNSKPVQDAVTTALEKFEMSKSAAIQNGTLTAKDAHDLMNALAGASGGKIESAALEQIKKSPEYKRLEKAVQEFLQAAKTSPMGVWVDKHKKVVYITGIAMVLGGVAALFITKTGGRVVNFAADHLKNKPIKIFKVGSFTLQGQLLAFRPDQQQLGAGLILTRQWEQMQVSVGMGLITAGPHVQQINGSLAVKTSSVTVTSTVNANLAKHTYNLHLNVNPNLGLGPSPATVGIGVNLTQGTVTGGSLSGSYKTRYGDFGLTGSMDHKTGVSGLATWTIPLP